MRIIKYKKGSKMYNENKKWKEDRVKKFKISQNDIDTFRDALKESKAIMCSLASHGIQLWSVEVAEEILESLTESKKK